jgi:hypothetical protein
MPGRLARIRTCSTMPNKAAWTHLGHLGDGPRVEAIQQLGLEPAPHVVVNLDMNRWLRVKKKEDIEANLMSPSPATHGTLQRSVTPFIKCPLLLRSRLTS